MNPPPFPGPIDPDDAVHLRAWLDYFGITVEQLREAIAATGNEPQAVTEHLLHQGGSAGAG
jgi:hypothetical protein